MASGTLVSRLTGFVRNAMLAAALGIGLHAELFNVANTIPNSLYILVAGGVFNTVLVPQLVRRDETRRRRRRLRKPDHHARRSAWRSSPRSLSRRPLADAAVPGARLVHEPPLAAQRESLIDFSRYCLLQIFFYGMFVLIGQILNARGRFGPMMWAPIANNVMSIAVLVSTW